MLEDLGNCVKIHDTVIPAANIQVEGFPKFCGDDWYGIYFEILFENGDLWEINQNTVNSEIIVTEYRNWVKSRTRGGPGYTGRPLTVRCPTWEEFVEYYEGDKVLRNIRLNWKWKEFLDV